MKKLLLLIAVTFAIFCQAQKVPYEKLDSISTAISKLQFETNGLTYNDGKTDYEISFPEANFQVAFSNQLATKAIYKKSNGKELLYLTENIDLSKAIGIVSFPINKDMLVIKLYFPQGYLKTQIIENGTKTKTISEEYLEFFRVNKDLNGSSSIFNSIYDLCTSIKKEKKLITQKIIDEENSDWKKLTLEAYIQKHPNSLKTMQAKLRIKTIEKQKLEYATIADFSIKYGTEISTQFLWKPNMTASEFTSYNGTIYQHKWNSSNPSGETLYTRDFGTPLSIGGYFPDGPQSYTVNEQGKVTTFSVFSKRVKKAKEEIRKFYEDSKKNNALAGKYFTDNGNSYTIAIPKSVDEPMKIQYYITTSIMEIDKWSIINVNFHKEKSSK